MHRSDDQANWGRNRFDSGLGHQRQRRGHPFRKTVVRMPGPSRREQRWMSKTIPSVSSIGRSSASGSEKRSIIERIMIATRERAQGIEGLAVDSSGHHQ